MNKSLLAAGLVLATLPPGLAMADEDHRNPSGIYLGATIGADIYDDDDINEFETGGALGLQLGYRWTDHFRTELELNGSAAGLEGSDDVLGYGRLAVGGYFDLAPTDQSFVPYVGAGIGVASVVLDSDNGDEDTNGLLSLHGEAGLSLNVNEHFALVPSYRYTWVEDDSALLDDDLTSHSIRLGARLSF